MKTKKLFLAAFAIAVAASVQAQSTGTFNLKISNVKNPTATIHVGFYKADNEFPTQGKHAFAKQFVPGKQALLRFPGIKSRRANMLWRSIKTWTGATKWSRICLGIRKNHLHLQTT